MNNNLLITGYRYNLYEERILKTLKLAFRSLTTRQIAMFSGISYNTVKIYLIKLNQNKIVSKLTKGNKIYWGIK
jgi:Fic family protein